MRLTALLGCAVLVVACAKSDTPPAADTSTAATTAPASAVSLAALAGMWDVTVKPEGKDTVLTTYVLNTMDSTAWTFVFPNRTDTISLRVTGVSAEGVMTEAGPFKSNVRGGDAMVSTSGPFRLENGKMVGITTARYQTTGPDSVVRLSIEGIKR